MSVGRGQIFALLMPIAADVDGGSGAKTSTTEKGEL